MRGIVLANIPWPGLLGNDRAPEEAFNNEPSDSRWYVCFLNGDPWLWDCRKNPAVCEQAASIYHEGK